MGLVFNKKLALCSRATCTKIKVIESQKKLKCLRQATSSTKKKSLIYLANDVLQNGIKKKTSYTDYYIPIMPIAFASFGICDQ